ncbi:MAG: hypothetical protein AAF607_09015 [Pseudomonadota bacterium]
MARDRNNTGLRRIIPQSSLVMIISGAVFGWLIAFAVIYGLVRGLAEGDDLIAVEDKANNLSEIAPAAGE